MKRTMGLSKVVCAWDPVGRSNEWFQPASVPCAPLERYGQLSWDWRSIREVWHPLKLAYSSAWTVVGMNTHETPGIAVSKHRWTYTSTS